jgi:long-chain acyl-CoA synthetase
MLGYWKDEEATKENVVNGWFRTGDLGRISKRGLIHVTGRVKSMIVLKNGKKVFPEEIEALINKLDYVKESFVWGEKMQNGDVEICAKIVIDEECIQSLVHNNEKRYETLTRPLRRSTVRCCL